MYARLICKKCGAAFESHFTLHFQILGFINAHLRENKGCTEKDIEVHIVGNFAT